MKTVKSIVVSILCIVSFSCRLTAASDVVWKVSSLGESPVQTCGRHNLFPTGIDQYISWNQSIFENVLASLNKTVFSRASDTGLYGCCSSGLWCTCDGCFSQSFGDGFINYGSFISNLTDLFPVYSCLNNSSLDGGVEIDNVVQGIDNSIILYSSTASSLGVNESVVDVFVDSSSGTSVELCNTVCKSCSFGNPCPHGSLCYTVADGNTAVCLLNCGGYNDRSCPCNTHCSDFYVHNIKQHLCVPDDDSLCQESWLQDRFTCDWHGYSNNHTENVLNDVRSFSVVTDEVEAVNEIELTMTSNSCSSNVACSDGDVCTIDVCNDGTCTHFSDSELIDSCQTTKQRLRERNSKYSYILGYQTDMELVQETFRLFLTTNGTLLTVSDVDDAPSFTLDLNESRQFDYFGNSINRMYINPNGVVMLPPLERCTLLISSLECVVYSTESNTISVWATDWDFKPFAESNAYYYSQTKGKDPQLYGVDADATHILYDNVTQYAKTPTNKDGNTFSVSIYADGSMRMRYHAVVATPVERHVFGLWGSRASTSDTYLKYHQETVPYNLISTGVDTIFCYLPNTIVSLVHNQVSPSNGAREEPLMVQWSSVSPTTCNALGTNRSLDYSCNWNSGYVTNATVTTTTSNNSDVFISLLKCTVPNMPYIIDGAIVSVTIGLAMTTSMLGHESVHVLSPMWDGSHAFHTVTREINSTATANGDIMVQYYSNVSNSVSTTSGACSALGLYTGVEYAQYAEVDRCGVCGGFNSTVDCAGECFGSASIDSCNICSGGHTGIPVTNCYVDVADIRDQDGGYRFSVFTFYFILFIVVIVCSCMYIVVMEFCPVNRRRAHLDELEMMELFNNSFFVVTGEDGSQRNHNDQPRAPGLEAGEILLIKSFTFDESMTSADDEEVVVEFNSMDGLTQKKTINNQGYMLTSRDIEMDHVGELGTSNSSNDAGKVSCPKECSICLCEFVSGEQCRRLPAPCDHVFHQRCIDVWFHRATGCPLCKRSIRDILERDQELYLSTLLLEDESCNAPVV